MQDGIAIALNLMRLEEFRGGFRGTKLTILPHAPPLRDNVRSMRCEPGVINSAMGQDQAVPGG